MVRAFDLSLAVNNIPGRISCVTSCGMCIILYVLLLTANIDDRIYVGSSEGFVSLYPLPEQGEAQMLRKQNLNRGKVQLLYLWHVCKKNLCFFLVRNRLINWWPCNRHQQFWRSVVYRIPLSPLKVHSLLIKMGILTFLMQWPWSGCPHSLPPRQLHPFAWNVCCQAKAIANPVYVPLPKKNWCSIGWNKTTTSLLR